MTVASNVGYPYEALNLWYFGDEGIKRSNSCNFWYPDGITDLSAKEKLRWSKVCEWLDNYFRRNPACQPGDGNLAVLLRKLEKDLWSTLLDNISDFPWDLDWDLHIAVGQFIPILAVLSLVYGGVHLATWNFAFASKTQHLLWKIACIDIMATVPVGILCKRVLDTLVHPNRPRPYYRGSEIVVPPWAVDTDLVFVLLSLPYIVSRIYIVVESFISLRHVPIGVYAAVPWVQAIPHV